MRLGEENIKKIGVFRALQLGDMLNAVPAFRSFRAAYPKAEIVLIGLPWAASFVERFHSYFNRFIPFAGYPGLPEQIFNAEKYEAFIGEIKKENFDLIFQMQGNGTIVNEMIATWDAKYTAGFHNSHSWVDSPLFMEYPDYGSEIRRHLLLMDYLGLPLQGEALEFPVLQKDEEEFSTLPLPVTEQYICVHPGSRGAWRQWPPAHFAKLADACAAKGLTVLLTGTSDEEEITQKVMEHMTYKAYNLTGKTSLGSIALLIKNAFCLIANCTGVSHIASATKTPSIIISMDGEPERWAPLDKDIHFVTDWTHFPDINIPFQQVVSLLETNLPDQKQSEK